MSFISDYTRLPSPTSSQSSLFISSKHDKETCATDEFIYPEPSISTRIAKYHLHWVIHLVNLVAIITLLIIALRKIDPSQNLKRCWNMHHYYCMNLSICILFVLKLRGYLAPINEAVNTHAFVETRFNGSLWHNSPFKGPPTPEVEEAWHSIMANGMIAVTAEDLLRAGRDKSLSTAAQFPPPPTKSHSTRENNRYVAVAVGTHQLHCLHYIWQDHYSSYFPDVIRKKTQVPDLYERHYGHCIDFIRQSLMCHFDTSLVTYDWVLDHQTPTPNGNVMHKCVDWDVLQRWLGGRAVEIPDDFEWSQPEGQDSLSWNP
jgi:hypothetical protein